MTMTTVCDGDAGDQQAVDGRRQDLGAGVPEGGMFVGGAAGDLERHVGDDQAREVHEHVAGVGQECQAAGPDAGPYLDHQDEGARQQGDDDVAPVAAAAVRRLLVLEVNVDGPVDGLGPL